ncbi:MAG: DUF167 domain-containing protein [Treponema sp.]|nr:DUF167 domain-containing protein [Treponema sp.]
MENFFTADSGTIRLNVNIVPGSSRSEIREVSGGRLRIRIAAAPQDNKANEQLRSFMAEILGCAKKDIVILTGEKSRRKTISLPLNTRVKLEKLICP